ncbi:translesion DNA synthesis-associated protein ImuA [Azospira restricta]|uniref:Translesion DNA synthesis-associated protein ImuA n=1 Tax=Azospira restricta TaxID=404405 RepID=A0A974PWI7_9RHOO|nr:translesion DNA synthesis-associated protein ImuA [Azospira restricta]QRJ62524.1 translesion DNA synthesis-associated protein ImuA [Azospira restricta]
MSAGAAAAAGQPDLADVLARSDVWRGDTLAQAPLPGVPSGFGELDAELPGAGWPRGGLVELLPERRGIGEMALLMPALARISSAELAWVVCVAPPLPPYAPAWAAAGVSLSRLLVTRAAGGDAAWACARALEADGVGALVAWLPAADASTLRRLQLLAEKSRTLIFLFRPAAAVRESSPAPLRIALAAGRTAGRLSLNLLKRRGGARAAPLELDLARPAPLSSAFHVVAGAAPSAAAARSLSPAAAA